METLVAILDNGTTIFCSIISAVVALVVCQIQAKAQNDSVVNSMKNATDMMSYKIEELSKRVEKHNNLVERMYRVEQEIELHSEKIKVANNRIGDLEKAD